MPTTTRGYPYPSNSDDVDVPGDLLALATAVDTDVANIHGTAIKSTGATNGYVLTADGSGGASFLALSAAGADVQEFTSSGSWVKPAGKSAVYVLAVGGGGGGASGANLSSTGRGGNGGGGAAHVARWLVASTLAGTITVTVGAAGTGGTAAASSASDENGVDGAEGGNTSFGTVALALGGLGGAYITTGQHPTARGGAEWGQRLSSVAQGGTSDNPGTGKNFDQTDPTNLSFALAAGRSGFLLGGPANYAAVRAMTRTGGGGSGGGYSGGALNGGAGGRGFGFDGAIANGGTASGGAGTAAAAALGCGGGGGGGIQNGTAGAGAAGYLGGGGGGGGGVFRTSGSAQGGAGGNGGGGYVLVISV